MRYWFDTEFIENGRTIDLLSIGIVAEDGREFYAEVDAVEVHNEPSQWVIDNVIVSLGKVPFKRRLQIRDEVLQFVSEYPITTGPTKPEFWAYYADYDWVAFCQLFGTMMDLPKGWPMYCRDVKQLCDDLGNPALPEQGNGEHHALADARWTRQAWEFLQDIRERGQPSSITVAHFGDRLLGFAMR